MLPYPPMRLRLCGALALSALFLSACAPVASRPSIDQARASAGASADAGGQAEDPDELQSMQYAAPPMASVRELRDSELSCAEIYAETQALEVTARAQEAKVQQAQQVLAKSQEEMVKKGSGMPGAMGAIGSGLLGRMVPGGSLVAGAAMQAAASARTSAMQESTNKMMQTQTELMNTEQALQHTQARRDHLANLFLDNGCKLSEVQGAAGAAQ